MPLKDEVRPRLATLNEACAYGRFGRTQAYELINEGKIVAYKMGHRTMVDLNTVDQYHASLPRSPSTRSEPMSIDPDKGKRDMTEQSIEQKMVFAIAPEGQGDGVPLLLLGIPAGAWDHMKEGKTHTFDLTVIGLPVKLMLFGAADHATAMGFIETKLSKEGTPYLNMLDTDFSIKPPKDR
jgi:excisionase family DNA binding protein